jgi:hypothetical protein
LAIIACCPLNGMKAKLSAKPLSESILSDVDCSRQYLASASDTKILLVECLREGEDVKRIIEHLAELGIKTVIGYGFAESLTNQIPAGQIVLAEAAVTVEQSSCKFSYPHHGLFHDLRSCATKRCLSLRRAKVVSVDADDAECSRKIVGGKTVGAEVVSEQAARFYAAGRVNGVAVVYACVIGREIDGDVQNIYSPLVRQGIDDLQNLINGIAAETSNAG